VDHIVPARLIRRLNAGNPDRRENLQCICGTCHGYKLQADHKLCLGDRLGYLEVRDPRITPESIQVLRKSGRLASLLLNHEGGKGTPRAGIEQQPATARDVQNWTSDSDVASSSSVKSTRARRVWTEVARALNVSLETVERLIAQRSLKLYDSRITEKSFSNFCRRNGALINGEFLDGETREWLRSSMDWDRSAGDADAHRMNFFRKHALVVRRCTECGRDIRGNSFFRHIKRCGSAKSHGIKTASPVDLRQRP
jgi:hypothetical protein